MKPGRSSRVLRVPAIQPLRNFTLQLQSHRCSHFYPVRRANRVTYMTVGTLSGMGRRICARHSDRGAEAIVQHGCWHFFPAPCGCTSGDLKVSFFYNILTVISITKCCLPLSGGRATLHIRPSVDDLGPGEQVTPDRTGPGVAPSDQLRHDINGLLQCGNG